MTAAHSDREHATWSASATERNWNCPGALALTLDVPEQTSEAADWGTCCHQIAEKCLRKDVDADSFIGETERGKEHAFTVDEEMAETAQIYVDYVRAVRNQSDHPATLWVEQKFSLASLKPPFDAGGTADAVLYTATQERLEVVDLKGGRGVAVDATENKQLRTYALGAMLANRGLRVSRVVVTIVQPRAPHRAGRIRSETFHITDLIEWAQELLAKMKESHAALLCRKTTPSAAWAQEYLRPGPWCSKTFCKAQGFCPAVQKAAYDAASVWFDDHDQPKLANKPDDMSPEALAQALDAAELIEGWIKAVRAFAHSQAEGGITIPNYVLVEKEGREVWVEGAEQRVLEAIKKAGLPPDKYLNAPKLKTPKQVRKALGKEKETVVAGLSAAYSTGTNLVRADKTTRSAVKSTAERHFDILD